MITRWPCTLCRCRRLKWRGRHRLGWTTAYATTSAAARAQNGEASTAGAGGAHPKASSLAIDKETLGLAVDDMPIEVIEPEEDIPIARLRPGLDRVLFKSGVHWLTDPESGDFNFDHKLRYIDPPATFDYDALTPYKTSSKDSLLQTIAKRAGTRFTGSTSSLTETLSQIYHFISRGQDLHLDSLSSPYRGQPTAFTKLSRTPSAVCLRRKDNGTFAVDANKIGNDEPEEPKDTTLLMSLGKSMEKMLTLKHDDYQLYLKRNSHKLDALKADPKPENYAYSKAGDILMRSQIDCMDDRLPNKTFDLKTRAAISIRLDLLNHKHGRNYQIVKKKGLLQSFEREYYDMVRSVFLKYNFQARIGRMDGIFVAYHNTFEIFGFQYISLDEMAKFLFGSSKAGNNVFRICLLLLNRILNRAADLYGKDRDVSILSSYEGKRLHICIEPAPATKTAVRVPKANDKADGNLHVLVFKHTKESLSESVGEMDKSNVIKSELSDGVEARKVLARTFSLLHAKKGLQKNITDHDLAEMYAQVRSGENLKQASGKSVTGSTAEVEASATEQADNISAGPASSTDQAPETREDSRPKTVLNLIKCKKSNELTTVDVKVVKLLSEKGYKLPSGLILLLRRIAYQDKKKRVIKLQMQKTKQAEDKANTRTTKNKEVTNTSTGPKSLVRTKTLVSTSTKNPRKQNEQGKARGPKKGVEAKVKIGRSGVELSQKSDVTAMHKRLMTRSKETSVSRQATL